MTYSRHCTFVIPVSLKMESVSDSSFMFPDVRDVNSSFFYVDLSSPLQSPTVTEGNS